MQYSFYRAFLFSTALKFIWLNTKSLNLNVIAFFTFFIFFPPLKENSLEFTCAVSSTGALLVLLKSELVKVEKNTLD